MYAPLSFALHYYLLRLGMFSSYAIMTHAIRHHLGRSSSRSQFNRKFSFFLTFRHFLLVALQSDSKSTKPAVKDSQFFVGWTWIFPIYHWNTFLHLWKGLKIGAKNGHFLPCFLLDFRSKTTISCGLNLYFFLKPQFCIIITDSTWVECGNISHPLTFTTSYPRSARYFISLASVAESQLT